MPGGQFVATQTIKQRVGNLLRPFWSTTQRTYAGYSDAVMYLPAPDEIAMFLQQVPIENDMGLGEGFDCDDHAFVLKGRVSLFSRSVLQLSHSMCIGVAWAKFAWVVDEFHAANWTLTSQGTFIWIEPQDKTMHAIHECRGDLTALVV